MHQNREISSTPWSDDQGRSAKAMNRTAGMPALEKSDCVVLPVKQPNKEGQPSAEGRAQTKENIVQSHMHPTQSGKRMSQGLVGVRKAARERKQERFTALLHHLSIELLRDSFYGLQRKASPGVFRSFLRGGVDETRKTVWSFCGAEGGDMAPLEGGRVAA
jgi:RNA-directed DNA polymerase